MNKKLIVEVYKGSNLKQMLDVSNVPEGMMLVEGVLGRVDSRNRNKRFYARDEYAKHVGLMQQRIAESNGVFGEMEHPKSMNINLNNVSHKVTEVRIDESGFVRGKVLLLDTPSGKIAQSIVRSGSPLPISSRAVGQVLESGEVKLDLLSTYDLVGTAGFAEAAMTKAVYESFDEEGKLICETYEYDIDSAGEVVQGSTLKGIVESVEARLSKNFISESQIDEIVEARLSQRLTEINEGLGGTTTGAINTFDQEALVALMNEQFANVYSPILENWIKNEFAPEFGQIVENWATGEFAPKLGQIFENWLANDYSTIVENWIKEDVLPHNATITESWLKDQFAPKFGTVIQEWLAGDYANILENWMSSKFAEKGQVTESQEVIANDPPVQVALAEKTEAEKAAEEAADKGITAVVDPIHEHANVFKSRLLSVINESVDKANAIPVPVKPEQQKIDEALFAAAPIWLKLIPTEYKTMWQALNESQRDQVYKRASVRLIESADQIQTFWKSIDFETIAKGQTRTRPLIVTEDANVPSPRSRIGAFAQSLR